MCHDSQRQRLATPDRQNPPQGGDSADRSGGETKARWKRQSFPRFEKDARLAARAAEILLIDKDPENARKAAEIALNLPNGTEAERAKAHEVLAQINGDTAKP